MTNPNEEDERKSEEGAERSTSRKMSEASVNIDSIERNTISASSATSSPKLATGISTNPSDSVETGDNNFVKENSATDVSEVPQLEQEGKETPLNLEDVNTSLEPEDNGMLLRKEGTPNGLPRNEDEVLDVRDKDRGEANISTCDTNSKVLPTISEGVISKSSGDDEKQSSKNKESASNVVDTKRDSRKISESGDDKPVDNSHIFNDNEHDKVEERLNGNATGLEKPKRIFQKPPEEYLPMLEEQSGARHYDTVVCEVEPLDGGWGWMVVFASFMIHVFADGFTYTLGIFYVHLLSYYGVSKAAAAWIVSILVGVTLGSGPISGALVNKFGCRIVTIGGAFFASFMLFVSIYATCIEHLYITIGIGAGLGFGMIYLPAIVCVTGYFEKKRSFATGIAVCGSGLGTFVFSPLVEYLIASYNWKGALIVISGLVLNCVFFGALFRPLEDNFPREQRRRQYLPQYSTEGCSPDTLRRQSRPPRIQVSGDPSLRQNLSELSLGSRILGRRRGPRHLVTGSIAAEDMDIQRIKSHGHLNPNLAAIKQSDVMRMTVSQPLVFPKPEHGDRSPSPSKLTGSQSGLLHRKDIFYRGSLLNIPEYKRNPTAYRESIVFRRTEEEEEEEYMKSKSKVCGCIPCSRETKDTLHSLTDFGLLADPIFQLFALSNFFTSIGFYAPYVFIVDRALDIGIASERTATLLAVVGLSNTISRVVLGYISDLPWINRLYVYNVALTICGIGTCASIWMLDYSSQIAYAAIFGCTSGAYVGLTSVVLVDLLGMEKLTNAFGLLLLAQGIASVIGPPLCGSLYEWSQNYNYTFLLAGSMIAISGIMLFVIPFMSSYKLRMLDNQRYDEDEEEVHDKDQHV